MAPHPQKLTVTRRAWPLARPLMTVDGVVSSVDVVVAEISDTDSRGRGECVPLPRYGESPESVVAQLEAMRGAVASGLNRDTLQSAMPPGAARNALDCAFWDMDAKRSYCSVTDLAGFGALMPVLTAVTLDFDTPDKMAEQAADNRSRPLLRLELGGDGDIERVRAVREAAPAARLIVDAQERWSASQLRDLVPALTDCRVGLIEQPLPADADDALARLGSPIPICADESCRTVADLDRLDGKYQAVCIKLDKVGGLDRGAVAGGGSEAAGFADHGRGWDLHVAWGRAGAAGRAAGRDRGFGRAIAPGARSRWRAALRRKHDPSGRSEALGWAGVMVAHGRVRRTAASR